MYIKNKYTMIIKIKDNIMYETFKTKVELQSKILNMILNSKTDKILFKGNPNMIDYKLMKKVIQDKTTENHTPETIKTKYNQIVSVDCSDFCIIYKQKGS